MKENNVQAFIKHENIVHQLDGGISNFISGDDFQEWFKQLEQFPLTSTPEKPRLIHLMYEAGAFLLENKPRSMPFYAIDTSFDSVCVANPIEQKLIMKRVGGPSFAEYESAYQKVQKELFAGNAYQVNLTFPFKYDVATNSKPLDAASFMYDKNAASFAQSIYWPHKKLSFISNSPETLFTARPMESDAWRVCSKPIKGTAQSDHWQELVDSQKDQAELLMITDLVRNDLNKLSNGNAQVDVLKQRLDVLGLVHQFSEVSATVASSTTLGKIIKSLFPGGSITGAPKRNVAKIIDEIESEPRGFYCGSTILWDGKGISASINIRSGTIDWSSHTGCFHAGGGVTVQSTAQGEWEELLAKLSSLEKVITRESP